MLTRIHGTINDIERTEQAVKAWLESTRGTPLPGLAVFNCNVKSRRGKAQQIDAIIWTPHGCFILEVKGLTKPQSGTLTLPANGPWTIDGEPAALHTRSKDYSPYNQAREGMFAQKDVLRDTASGQWIRGVIAVLPGRTWHVECGQQATDDIEVIACPNKNPLRAYLYRLRESEPSTTTADEVLTALGALDLSFLAPTTDELIANRFPATLPAPSPTPPPRPSVSSSAYPPPTAATRPLTPEPPPAAAPYLNHPNPQHPRTPTPQPATPHWAKYAPFPGAAPVAPRSRARRRWLTPARIIAFVMVGGVIWLAVGLVLQLRTFVDESHPAVPLAEQRAYQPPLTFTTPSGNLTCRIGLIDDVPAAQCDAAEVTFDTAGTDASDCGQTTLVVRKSEDARLDCVPPVDRGAGGVLDYGLTATLGAFSCTSEPDGVSCWQDGGHGFHISRDSFHTSIFHAGRSFFGVADARSALALR